MGLRAGHIVLFVMVVICTRAIARDLVALDITGKFLSYFIPFFFPLTTGAIFKFPILLEWFKHVVFVSMKHTDALAWLVTRMYADMVNSKLGYNMTMAHYWTPFIFLSSFEFFYIMSIIVSIYHNAFVHMYLCERKEFNHLYICNEYLLYVIIWVVGLISSYF